jgi:hypothetical protein
MKKRRVMSYSLFVLAVVLLLLFGLAARQWLTGVFFGLVFLLAGLFFYRRGK